MFRNFFKNNPIRRLFSDEVKKTTQEIESVIKYEEIIPAYVTSEVPENLITERHCRIYKPSKTAMQSGIDQTKYWQIDFDPESKWENPMIGYVSSADAVQALRLRFNEKKDAIYFAEKQGWSYTVEEEQQRVFKKKVYADNFKHYSDELRIIRTK